MLTRRQMIRLGLLGGAGLLLPRADSAGQRGMGGGGMGGGGGGGMGGGVIDPPPGAPLLDLPTLPDTSTTPGIVQVSVDVRVAPVNVNGVTANLFTYNGASPAPIIRVRPGDILRVHFTNSLPYTTQRNMLGFVKNVTNLHTHGLHVSPREPADAAHIAIWPADTPPASLPTGAYLGSYDYEYDLGMQDPGSLNIYHCHSHGLVAEQYWGGMVGPIIVEDATTALSGYETHVLVLKDISLTGSEPTPHTMTRDFLHGMEGSTVMVNGQVNPVLTIRPGQVQRWRVLNASNARFYKLSLEGHTLQVIGTDGGLLDRPYAHSYVVLSPGERVDLLVKASSTKKNYRLLSLPYSRMGMMTSAQITLLTMACKGTSAAGSIPPIINPDARRLDVNALPIAATRNYVLSMGMGRGYINGLDFDVMPDETHSALGTYEIWNVINNSNMDHPWHQHVNVAQVLSVTGGDSVYRQFYTTAPALKDTTLIPKGGSVSLLVKVADWPGMTMYHCHILEHEDIGMMGMWHIMDDMGDMGGM